MSCLLHSFICWAGDQVIKSCPLSLPPTASRQLHMGAPPSSLTPHQHLCQSRLQSQVITTIAHNHVLHTHHSFHDVYVCVSWNHALEIFIQSTYGCVQFQLHHYYYIHTCTGCNMLCTCMALVGELFLYRIMAVSNS